MRAGRAGGRLRALSGVLAGGLVALLVALCVAWFVTGRTGASGPGPAVLAWHALAAVAAVFAQRRADRDAGRNGALAAVAVIGITAAVLAAQWLA
jgi:hypothetical protein